MNQVDLNTFSEHGNGTPEDNILVTEQGAIATAFFRPGDIIGNKQLYTLGNGVSQNYQSMTLPLQTATAIDANRVTCTHNLSFDTTTSNAALQQQLLMEFETSTIVQFNQERRTGIMELLLTDFLPYTWAVTASTAGVVSYIQIPKAFTTYQMQQALQFGLNQRVTINILPPAGYVAAAYAAATTPYIPGTGGQLPAIGGTPVDRAFKIQLRFFTIQQDRKV